MYPAPASTISVVCVTSLLRRSKRETGTGNWKQATPLPVSRLSACPPIRLSASRRQLHERERPCAAAVVVERRNRAVALRPGDTVERPALRANPLVLRRPPPRPDHHGHHIEFPRRI